MARKISTIKRIRVLGDFMMFGIFVCLLIIFLTAYFNGLNSDNYTTEVDINSKNEAHVEFIILIIILLPIFFLTTLWSFLDWKSTWKAREQIRFQDYYYEVEAPPRRDVETILMKCSACKEVFGVTAVEDEMNIECPNCNKKGSIKVPPSYRRRSRDTPSWGREDEIDFPGHHEDDYSRGKSPKVRIIKDIRDR
ncbi:MAG: hypothetical protein JSV49_08245 [Thermoplasmata archaeon]|nr:MAG: hypothetical protein JSV49_08245 [Thermoplasmata archaeon]